MVPVYVEHLEEFIDEMVWKRRYDVGESFRNPNYWEERIKNFDDVSPDYFPYSSMGIKTREELRKALSDSKKRNELEERVIAVEIGLVRINLSVEVHYAQRIEPLAFPVVFFSYMIPQESWMRNNMKLPFYFGRLSFENIVLNDGKKPTDILQPMVMVSSQTNSLVNYIYAAIYAQQIANSEPIKSLSAAELKNLRDIGLVVDRHSVLEETYIYFKNMYGSQNPATHFVEIVLKNNRRLYVR